MGDPLEDYRSQAQLEAYTDFRGRAVAAATQQAATYINDQRPDFVAVANSVLKGYATQSGRVHTPRRGRAGDRRRRRRRQTTPSTRHGSPTTSTTGPHPGQSGRSSPACYFDDTGTPILMALFDCAAKRA